jgi:Zn-dependent protease/CBS domain-containing protein
LRQRFRSGWGRSSLRDDSRVGSEGTVTWSFRVARIAGIPLRVHVTFALILVWGAYYWGSEADDGLRGALFGVTATLLLFACVTLHELGHSLQARRYNIVVEDITLYPIGGVARLREIPRDPVQEFWIAIAGPLVNVALLGLLLLVSVGAGEPGLRGPSALVDELRNPVWQDLLPYLMFANLSLALFNLLPAFPMDGGRILRSLLAMRMDYGRATSIAAAVGQGMALLFGLYGVAAGQIFMIVLAIFVWMGASEEGRQANLRGRFGTTAVGQAMIRQPWTLSPEWPLRRAAELTLSTSQSDFPVVDPAGVVIGLLTLSDLLDALSNRPGCSIADAMDGGFQRARFDEPILDAHDRMTVNGLRALPVVDSSDRLIGLLTARDIAELLSVIGASRTGR